MHQLSKSEFLTLLEEAPVRSRLRKEVRYRPEDISAWDELELVGVPNRSEQKGVLLLQPYADMYVIAYELSNTGHSRPTICDFCYTWQTGRNIARITFDIPDTMRHTLTYLCCADLKCSDNVRLKTDASMLSKVQLGETIRPERRIERLRARLIKLVQTLNCEPVKSYGKNGSL